MIINIVGLDMPPSVNSLYFVKGGRKILSSKGRTIKNKLKADILKQIHHCKIEESPKTLVIKLFFTDIYNKGWPKKAKSRYKKIDASNRAKLLEDALSECLGIDDCLFFSVTVIKYQSEVEYSYSEIIISDFEEL